MQTIADILGEGGAIARRLERYELRKEQLAMAESVLDAFRNKRHIAVEAGTGVGKSFGYLVPAILLTADTPNTNSPASPVAAQEDEEYEADGTVDGKADGEDSAPRRVVISTHTISLQEQIIDKDVPFLQSVLPFEFTAVLVKGRSNYLCLRRFHSMLQKQDTMLPGMKSQELQRLLDWSKSERSGGSKVELNPEPDWEVWNEVCCETGNCLGKKCLHEPKCFYRQARRRIAQAQILVVNHALLFSDLAVRSQGGSILPVYHYLVFDEAHTVPQVAADHLGLAVTQGQVEYHLQRLYNARTQKGLLMNQSIPKEWAKKSQQAVEQCLYGADTLFRSLEEWLITRPGSNGRVREPRIVENTFSGAVRQLSLILRDIKEKLPTPEERTEMQSAKERISGIADEADVWLAQCLPDDSVYWIEAAFTSRGRSRITMNAVPIDIGPILRERLFNEKGSVVLTSATLTN